MPPDIAFATDYHDARSKFLDAVTAFEGATGRLFSRTRCVIDAAEDLTIDVAELVPREPRRLYLVVAGLHGIEGYAGSAIERALLAGPLQRFDLESTGIVLVHALNPVGMHRMRRVNASNVDLNRNFAARGSELYATDSHAFERLRSLLEPHGRYEGGVGGHVRFMALLAVAVMRHGVAALRQVTLAGQYTAPAGIFYGGSAPEPETRYFQECFASWSDRYPEVLLTDLHTGYGERAQASALFGRADSPEMQEFVTQGVRDAHGHEKGYAAHGDLVGYCHETAKRARPDGIFDGVVLELGTHGLGTIEQIDDLHTLVRENQIRHYGARDPHVETLVMREFRELFYPGDPLWRRESLAVALERIENLLTRRGFLPPT